MHIYIYIYIYIHGISCLTSILYIYICVLYIYICVYIYTCTGKSRGMYICLDTYIYMMSDVCIYVDIYIHFARQHRMSRQAVHIYIYIYSHIYIHGISCSVYIRVQASQEVCIYVDIYSQGGVESKDAFSL